MEVLNQKRYCGHYCSIKNCSSKSSDGIAIFKLPQKPLIAAKWREFINVSGNPKANSARELRICRNHFRQEDISMVSESARQF